MAKPMVILILVFFLSALTAGNPTAQQDPGKDLVRSRCTRCHTSERIRKRIGKLDGKQWKKIVEEMIEKGASLNPEEKQSLIGFLTSQTSAEAIY